MQTSVARAIQAIKQNDLVTLNTLIRTKRVDVNARDENGYSLITWAAQEGNAQMIELLASNYADINDNKNINKSTPLHCAVSQGHLEAVKKLIKLTAQVNLKNKFDKTPLSYAIKNNQLEIATVLIANNADVRVLTKDGESLMHIAVAQQNPKIFELLHQNHLNLNHKDRDGLTPLHVAAFLGNAIAIKELIALGANINLRSNEGKTALHMAVDMNEKECSSLLSKTRDINTEDYSHRKDLAIIFNNENLNRHLRLTDPVDYDRGGGHVKQFINLAEPLLEKFLQYKNLTDQFKTLLKNIKNIHAYKDKNSTELIEILKKDDYILLASGTNTHEVPVVIRKNEKDEWQLTLINRGFMAKTFAEIDNKSYPVMSITIPANKLDWVINLVKDAGQLSEQEAAEILLKKIPAGLGGNYIYDKDVIQKPFKRGYCYFENYKSVVLYEFIHAFGQEKGRSLYKEFDIYMHEEVLKDYTQHFEKRKSAEPSFPRITSLCASTITKKKENVNKPLTLWTKIEGSQFVPEATGQKQKGYSKS